MVIRRGRWFERVEHINGTVQKVQFQRKKKPERWCLRKYKHQLSLMNTHDVLHHGKCAENKVDSACDGRRFRVIASYWSKVANFSLPHLHLVPSLGVTAFEFCQIFSIRKLESLGYHVALFA